MSETNGERGGGCSRWWRVACAVSLAAGLACVVAGELPRWRGASESGRWGELLIDFNPQTTLPGILFVLLPVFWFIRRAEPKPRETVPRPRPLRTVVACLFVGGLSLGTSYGIASRTVGPGAGVRFGDLPPAYHDEYSYLFQARTFLAGRVSFPGQTEHPERFSQMHVLTTPTYCSRYFPATGLVIAPFEALGHPYWGHWLCGALAAMFLLLAGQELDGFLSGLLAGTMFAVSPGVGIFSNLLLAHHPTTLGLAVFLYFFLRMQRMHGVGSGLCSGAGLAFAMLARPMSAAGFALPFGVWLLIKLMRPGDLEGGRKAALKMNLAVGLPVVGGLVLLLFYDAATTGDPLTPPYSLFMQRYTPKHVYGFDNVQRGEGKRESDLYRKYDDWAENLTPARAASNVERRVVASMTWVWGVVPLAMAGVFWLVVACSPARGEGVKKLKVEEVKEHQHVSPFTFHPFHFFTPNRPQFLLVGLALISMHLAHVPYWYEGIQYWHYVFETSLVWVLLLAVFSSALFRVWWRRGAVGLMVWWGLMLVAPLLPMYAAGGDFWGESRVQQECEQIAFSRLRFKSLNDRLAAAVGEAKAILLIHHDPADIHIDYVHNRPQLDDKILRVRSDAGYPTPEVIGELRRDYPGRELWYFDAATGELVEL